MKISRIAPLILTLLVAACSPAVRNTTFLSQLPPARPDDHPIRIYYSRLPACAYDEIGLVTASRPNWLVSQEDVRSALVAEARRMGGDALVNVSERSDVSGRGETVAARRALQGTVVRFTDASCDEPTAPVARDEAEPRGSTSVALRELTAAEEDGLAHL